MYWDLPREGTFKCNSDYACKGHPGHSAGAFCIRNDAGNLMFVECRRLGLDTNSVVEVVALRLRLEYCRYQYYLPLTLEIDSLSTKKILDGIWEMP